jgi:hypothetical protein
MQPYSSMLMNVTGKSKLNQEGKKKKSTEEFTKTEAIGSHQSFIDNYNPNRSDNIEHPCGCINCSLLISLARRSHYHVFPSTSVKKSIHIHIKSKSSTHLATKYSTKIKLEKSKKIRTIEK